MSNLSSNPIGSKNDPNGLGIVWVARCFHAPAEGTLASETKKTPSNPGPKPQVLGSCLFTDESASVAIHEDGSFAIPLRIVVRDPDAGCPLADVLSTGKNAGALDVSDLDNVLVLAEYIAQLLAGCTVSHCAFDVLKDFCCVSWTLS